MERGIPLRSSSLETLIRYSSGSKSKRLSRMNSALLIFKRNFVPSRWLTNFASERDLVQAESAVLIARRKAHLAGRIRIDEFRWLSVRIGKPLKLKTLEHTTNIRYHGVIQRTCQ